LEQDKHQQERECAETFMGWRCGQRGDSYKLKRAEEVPKLCGRWDFVGRVEGSSGWIALEVKSLVVSQSLRQFGSWAKCCARVTKRVQGNLQGEFAVLVDIEYEFDQKQSGQLVEVIANVLVEAAPQVPLGDVVNLGSEIADRFSAWPTEPPRIDPSFPPPRECKFIYPPKELCVQKLKDTGCSVAPWSQSQPYCVSPALIYATEQIFNTSAGKGSKPNEQLNEAKVKGASETILLLDLQTGEWQPNVVAYALNQIDRKFVTAIDSIYLVSVSGHRVKRVGPQGLPAHLQ
jgi:hypothetical protein